MQNLVKRLEKKGWKRNEIIKAVGIIQKAKHNKTRENLFLEKRIYWVLLVLIITANFAIAVAMMPLLVALKDFSLYIAIIALGIMFGLAFELVIRSIGHLEKKHHLALAAIIPVTAVANAFLMARFSNRISLAFGSQNFHEPVAVSLVYGVFFALPYIICRFVLKKGYYSRD